MTDRIGQQLGNYYLAHLLGQGGFAEVYLGKHLFLGTTIAIKVLHTQVAPEDTAQFQQEARILACLKHPHIVNILDFGIEEQTPYLVMNYAPYGTLRTRHPKGTTLPIATVVEYVKQVAQALQYAHDRKIVHRDIKPENMLINDQNEIILSDFGIALVTQSSRYQSTQEMAGTLAYSAPEQIQGKPRPASDQYALGIVVYEWLSGDRPFHGSLTELVGQHLTVPPPSLRNKQPLLSPALDEVVMRALAKDPHQRFSNIHAFATALEQASQGTLTTEPARSIPLSSLLPPTSPSLDAHTLLTVTSRSLVPPPPQPAGLSGMSTTQADKPASMFIPATETQPYFPMPTRMPGKARASRRNVLIGMGIAAIAAVGASVFVVLHIPSLNIGPTTTTTSSLNAGPATTAADFLNSLSSNNYNNAYQDLGPAVTIRLNLQDFTRQAQALDQQYGHITNYVEVNGSATINNNTESFSYTITRAKPSIPYKLTVLLQQDANNNNNWKIVDYGTYCNATVCYGTTLGPA